MPDAPIVTPAVDDKGATDGAAAAAAAAATGAAAAGAAVDDKAKAGAGGTILDGVAPKVDDKAGDWRAELTTDPEELKRLSRFADKKALFQSYRSLEKKMAAGEAPKPTLGDNPTEDEVKAFRAANGIPETADKYEITPPEGFVFGEADKPLLESFKAHAHTKNWNPAQLNDAVGWYAAEQARIAAARDAADGEFHTTSIAELAADWGPEFKANVNSVANLLATAPDGVAERIQGGRTADGKKLGDDPGVMRWLAQLSRELNPAATLLPAGQTNQAGLEARINEIKDLMTQEPQAYWGKPAVQKEYRELLAARAKIQARAA